MVLSIGLAVLAAVANATASVLQRKADREEGEDRCGLAMMWDLAHRPTWIGGIAAIIVGFLLQAGALATGPIALVQPILVLKLDFTLLLASLVFGSRLHRREWAAVVAMSVGLVLLLFSLQPSGSPAPRRGAGCAVRGGHRDGFRVHRRPGRPRSPPRTPRTVSAG